MLRFSLVFAATLALTGCVVAPLHGRVGVYVPPVQVTVQPTVPGEVYLDTHVNLYFVVDIYHRRHYMPYGWRPHRRY